MKNILLILILLTFVSLPLVAQTDKMDKLAEQMTELAKQQAEFTKQMTEVNKQLVELAKQQAVTNTEIKGLDKRFDGVDKRFDTQSMYTLTILAGIFGMIALVMWDKRTVAKPFEAKAEDLKKANEDLQKEITLLKERELKHEERTEAFFKKIAQIDARFAGIL